MITPGSAGQPKKEAVSELIGAMVDTAQQEDPLQAGKHLGELLFQALTAKDAFYEEIRTEIDPRLERDEAICQIARGIFYALDNRRMLFIDLDNLSALPTETPGSRSPQQPQEG